MVLAQPYGLIRINKIKSGSKMAFYTVTVSTNINAPIQNWERTYYREFNANNQVA